MTEMETTTSRTVEALLHRYWGFGTLRPLQARAVDAALAGRDSLVVLPTGGGKSLCYQLPPLVRERLDVVVSPLISLMKDQVDGLVAGGYPAGALHSASTAEEKRAVWEGLRAGTLRLLFVSPERLALDGFVNTLAAQNVGAFAVDEAHCISHWGHDFRPEYRQLQALRARFPSAPIHAFTATATPRVQEDIVRQLALRAPERVIGSFDRPNLIYRVVPRQDRNHQIRHVLLRHKGEASIVYCLSRKDTEEITVYLRDVGIEARAYHAGLPPEERRRVQEAFADEKLDVVVATIAFGMGIDRSNVRCVIHATMPKSIEHYQQETGRAGRDGLAAECVLLYSSGDVMRWSSLLTKSGETDGGSIEAQIELLRHMQGVCGTLRCRHAAIVEYFGEPYPAPSCGACDVCLGEVRGVSNGSVLAQKILSCVVRLEQRYGVGTVVEVLRGAASEMVKSRGHDQLSTYGIMREYPEAVVRQFVHQMIDQGLLVRSEGDRPVVQLGAGALEVLRGQRQVQLQQPKAPRAERVATSRAEENTWEGVDRALFDELRALRRTIAEESGLAPYMVFGDRTLRDIARWKPVSAAGLLQCHGVGEKKLEQWGEQFLEIVREARLGGQRNRPASDDSDS